MEVGWSGKWSTISAIGNDPLGQFLATTRLTKPGPFESVAYYSNQQHSMSYYLQRSQLTRPGPDGELDKLCLAGMACPTGGVKDPWLDLVSNFLLSHLRHR
jgi:hypothetical protein